MSISGSSSQASSCAVLIRTDTELVLKSRWVQPQKLIDAGFIFRQPELGRALLSIAKR